MTLSELIATIHKEIKKRDFLYEHTPANKELFNQKCAGTYEAVLTGHGNEKFLIPQVGTLHFLYRGQSIEHIPCCPSIYRGTPSEADIFIERMRLTMFQRLLESHPVKNYLNKGWAEIQTYEPCTEYGLLSRCTIACYAASPLQRNLLEARVKSRQS